MDEEFVSLLAKALELIRKRDMLKLGKHQLVHLIVVRQQAQPSDPPVRLGRITKTVIGELLDSRMRPEGPQDADRLDWRRYVLLQEYVFRGRTMGELMADLGISQALFFDTKKEAVEILADELWLAEQRAREQLEHIHENIPDPQFDFIGRVDTQGRDLVQLILDGLQNRPWVVSIRGFGGVGKTRLAIEAAWAAVKQSLFNRVVWVEITPDHAVSPDPLGLILDTIGKALGTRRILAVEEMEERTELVMELLSENKCLVVIDSTERVPDPQHEQVMQLVRSLPLPTCALIVSREMQRKTELETMIHLDGMQQNEALEFLAARADEHDIELTDEQAKYLYDVTQGNPRAMLLSLGWMAKYGLPAEDLLVPERREMSELLDHLLGRVYEKLDEDEERVLNVMPLFREPMRWPPIAAASALAEDPVRVKTALGNLYSRFLVELENRKEYSIAPLVHMYLMDRVGKPGARIASQSARDFRAQAYRRLIDHCLREFESASTQRRLDFVRDYRQTILDELRWSLNCDEHKRLTDLVFFVGGPLGELGYLRDKLEWGRSAIVAAEKLGAQNRAAWHKIYDVGWTHIQRGEYEDAERATKQGLAEAQELGYSKAESIALRNLAVIAMQHKEYEAAVDHLNRSLEIAEANNIRRCVALAKGTLGEAKLSLTEAAEARILFQQAYFIYEALGNPSWQSIGLSQTALACVADGDLDTARTLLARAKTMARTVPDPSRAQARALWVQGILHKEEGNLEEALRSLKDSQDMYHRLGQEILVRQVDALIRGLETVSETTHSGSEDDPAAGP